MRAGHARAVVVAGDGWAQRPRRQAARRRSGRAAPYLNKPKREHRAWAAAMANQNAATLRLMSDLREMQKDAPEGASAAPLSEENIFVWAATIFGPADTPWEGGIFSLRMTFCDQYPDKPPKVRFTTKVFHPNVYQDGTLCLDIIQNKWSPSYTVSSVLTSIQSLLTDPNCGSPANPEAAELFMQDKKAYNRRVRRLTEESLGGA